MLTYLEKPKDATKNKQNLEKLTVKWQDTKSIYKKKSVAFFTWKQCIKDKQYNSISHQNNEILGIDNEGGKGPIQLKFL